MMNWLMFKKYWQSPSPDPAWQPQSEERKALPLSLSILFIGLEKSQNPDP
jgi:hypothetical protein